MTTQPIVRLDHISFIRDHNVILHDISVLIDKGQHWAIIGPNGSGKTSLISIINGYHHPSEGTAQVLGRRFGKTDLRELRKHIGEASSEIKNMLQTEDKVKARMLLEFFGLSEKEDRPFNILSSGEQQKTLLARALMPEPELLVLDEPCAGLDMSAREELLDAIQKMCDAPGGPTLILVTHHIEEIIPAVTHALALRQGRVVAQGDKNDVLTGEVLSRTFDLSIEVQERYGRLWPVVLKN
ncbi:MAG: ATP-binding cassette domain-containing protein [Euryarchaeota archaeon]|nr:ATP-binding cassette domain-containing protein [Euryarchaeota archaeon]